MTGPPPGPVAGDVLLDISQLVHAPLRTGIQRVTRELIRFWPGPGRLVLCMFDPVQDALRPLPPGAGPLLIAAASGTELTVAEEHRQLHAMVAATPADPLPPAAGPVLNVELFTDPGRAAFYERMAADGRRDLFWLVYDFIPWLQPQWFPQFGWRAGMGYLHAALRMPNLAFISDATRDVFRRRIARNPGAGGPVIPLGGDGLDLEPQRFRPDRRGYLTLGTLEPRKRTAAAMEAFVLLWQDGVGAPLTVAGRLLDTAEREAALIAVLAGEPRFTHLPNASDAAVRDALRSCRALLFPSASEGFGLPPFEALFCGIPVVSAAGVPAVDMLPPGGRIVVDDPLPQTIAAAVRRLQDDAEAARLWDEAAALPVPTWRDFAAATAAWVRGA